MSHYDILADNSLAAALSAIEIYNKPDFKYRDEIFTILVINAWELLLKAKILKNGSDDITKLYVLKDGSPKLNRNGTPLTIDIIKAMNVVMLDPLVKENISVLIDIRDSAVHFYHSQPVSHILYTLGVAALKNFQKLMADWFAKSLLDYNFYILPLGFAYDFQTLSLIDLKAAPEAISNFIKAVTSMQSSLAKDSSFDFVCEIAIEVKKAKHLAADADLSVTIDPTVEGAVIVDRVVRLTEQYPFSYTELCSRVQKERPAIKKSEINRVIREYDIKQNPSMSAYNYRTMSQQKELEGTSNQSKAGIPSIYNENAARFIIEHAQPTLLDVAMLAPITPSIVTLEDKKASSQTSV